MSPLLLSRSADLKRLRDEGYEVEICENRLLVHHVPYVNAQKEVAYGILASDLTLAGDRTVPPSTHVVMFVGDFPCSNQGIEIQQLKHSGVPTQIGQKFIARFSFSCKPANGYADYFEKMTRYIEIISAPAASLDPSATAKTFKVIEEDGESVFAYLDTASSRAGIEATAEKLTSESVAIVGLGGTGAYVLDLVSKCPVRQIDLFDPDVFLQHNAFRAPGAAALRTLEQKPTKVEYLAAVYGGMHRKIKAHPVRVDKSNVALLREFSVVFVCIDHGPSRKIILDELRGTGVRVLDSGLDVLLVEGKLIGMVRSTVVARGADTEHIDDSRISYAEESADELYARNIQIAELNAMNATIAVLRWKKGVGVYQDLELESHITYSLNVNLLTSDP